MSTEKKEKEKISKSLNKNDRSKFRALTSILYIITNISRVFILVGISFLAIIMIAVPVITKNIKVEDNNITIFNEKYEYSVNNEGNVEIYKPTNLEEKEIYKDEENRIYKYIIESLKDDNMAKTFAFIEIELIGYIVVLSIYYFALTCVRNLLSSILKERTPFAKENSLHIRKIAYFMISGYVVAFMISLITEFLFGYSSGFDLPIVSIPAILGLFVVSYIFAYGYDLQKESKVKMFEEEE